MRPSSSPTPARSDRLPGAGTRCRPVPWRPLGAGVAAVLSATLLSATLLSATLLSATLPVAANAAGSGGGSVVLGSLVRRPGGYPGAPPGSTAAGAVPASTTLSLAVVLALPDPAAVAAAAAAVTTPGDQQYHHFLGPGQFAATYGPTAGTVTAVDDWLRQDGFSPGPAVDDLLVPFTAPAAAAERAFGVQIGLDRLPSGRRALVPNAAPLVPGTLAGAVAGISGLDTVSQPSPQLLRPRTAPAGSTVNGSDTGGSGVGSSGVGSPGARAGADQATGATACAAATAATAEGGYTDPQLAAAYRFSGLYERGQLGQGVTVAAVEFEPFLQSDVTAFDSCFGVSASVSVVPVDGGAGSGTGSGEAALDVEEISALAPDASVVAYEGPNEDVGSDDVYATIVGQDRAQVISTSWGQCEAMATADLSAETASFEQAALQGQTVVAASGDSGAEDCYAAGFDNDTTPSVDDPGTQPWVTSVGGTKLAAVGPTGAAASQAVWNDCQGVLSTNGRATACASDVLDPAGASGGGISSVWAMPSYQTAAGLAGALAASDSGRSCPDASGTFGAPSGVCRAVPDVASDGDPETGVTVYYNGGWGVVGGTSIASPLWASLVALADSGCSPANQVGELNTRIYPLASGPGGSSLFFDVTTGDNDLTGTNQGQYAAGPGYDLASGWGTPITSALVAALQPTGGCPVVDGLSATSGLARGGSPSTLTITGANLTGATAVHFGTVAASSFTVGAGGTTITVAPPAAASGPVDVTVTTPAGTSGVSGADAFDYVGPVVQAVSPAWGSPKGGQTVTITGSGFEPSGSGAGTTVHFGTAAATTVSVVSDSTVTAVVPAHAAGVVDVVVTNADGSSGTAPGDQYTYTGAGYRLVASDGGVFSYGVPFFGSTGNLTLNRPIVAMAATPDDAGYWLVASDGGVFAFGGAGFFGSTGNLTLDRPIVGMAATPDGGGYWLVASDGGIFAFGDAAFYGSVSGLPLVERTFLPVVALVPTPDGKGYWEVNSGGDVFAFGDAGFFGSTGNLTLDRPIVGMAATADGGGYWLVASDGGIFAFGDATFHGSTGGIALDRPIVGMAATADGGGYWLVASDGGVFAFGDAPFLGSTGGMALSRPIVGVAAG